MCPFSFSGKLTLLTVGLLNLRTIEPSDYRYRTCITIAIHLSYDYYTSND